LSVINGAPVGIRTQGLPLRSFVNDPYLMGFFRVFHLFYYNFNVENGLFAVLIHEEFKSIIGLYFITLQ
jgi:hypothetical protein